MLAFKYRLFPSNEQQKILWDHSCSLNKIYNDFLNDRINRYNTTKQGYKSFEQQNLLPSIKKNNTKLKDIHSLVLQEPNERLNKAFKAFFDRIKKGETPGFPKFKSSKFFYSIRYIQSGFSFSKNSFHTKAYGCIPFINHNPMKGNIKTVTIKNENNQWFLIVTTDYSNPLNITKVAEIGIDIGLKNLVVCSDGIKIPNKLHSKYFDKQIDKLKSVRDTKCQKKSRKYKNYSKIIKRLYDAKIRKMNDFQHKASKSLSRKYDTIFAEDLSTKEMVEDSNKTGLNRAIMNARFGTFLSMLAYKANKLILVNPKNTSKTCNNCGRIHQIKLSDRNIECICGNKYDRDENASKNIHCLGQAILKNICTTKESINDLYKIKGTILVGSL